MLQHGSKCIHHIDDVSQITCIDMIDNIVVAGRLNGTISFYQIKSNSCRIKLEEFDRLGLADGFSLLIDNNSNKSTITTIKISPCMKYIATGTIKGKVIIIDISKSCFNDGKIIFRILYSHEYHNELPVSALTWSITSNKLFSGCNGGLVIEINCSDIPNFKSSNSISQPLPFDISSIFGKKVTNIICKASMPIRQIECSISETKDLIEYVDLILVSTGLQIFLFQLPSSDKYKAKFKEIMYEIGKTDYNNVAPLACCCFSNSIDRTSDCPIRANSIYIVRQSLENVFLHYYTINGDIQETFTLKVINNDDENNNNNNNNNNMNFDKINFRFLSNFNSPSYKHALLAIDTEGNLFLINLQLMTIQILEDYTKNVYSACVYEDLIAIMKEDCDNPFTTVDLLQCISPIALLKDIKIFNMSLHSKICELQRKWRGKRIMDKKKNDNYDRKKKVLDLTIDCSDDDIYNYMLNLNAGIDTTRSIDKSKFGSFSYVSSYMDNLEYEIISKIQNVELDMGGNKDVLDISENDLCDDNDSNLWQKKMFELVSNFKNYDEYTLLSIKVFRIGIDCPSSQLEIEKLKTEVIKLNYSINLSSTTNNNIVDNHNILIAAEDTILTTILLLNSFENTDISWLPKLYDKLCEYDDSNIDIEYLCMDVNELCQSTILLLDDKGSSALGTLDRMNYTPLLSPDKMEQVDDHNSYPTIVSDELEDSTDLSFLKESGDWFDLWIGGGARGTNPYSIIKDRILSKKARTSSIIDSKGTDPINAIALDSLEGIYCSDPTKETYEITLEAPHGIGLSLVLSFDRTLEVVGFTKDMRGNQSPAESCGLIKIGDFLIGMNGMKFSNLKLEEIAETLKKMDKLEDKSVRLTFRYGGEGFTTKTDSSISADSPFMEGNDNPLLNLDGIDVTLNSRYSDHSANSPTIDDQINSTWVDSKGGSSFNGSALQFPLLNHPWVNQLTFEQLNDLTFDEWLAQTLRASQAIGLGGGSKENELQSDSVAPPISTEMIQSNIMSKHLYPVAAPITCFGHQSDHITQVREIANLAWELRAWYISANQSLYFCDDNYSRLIRTPSDKGSYKYTYHMVLDSSRAEFIMASSEGGVGSFHSLFDVGLIEHFRENNKKLVDIYPMEPRGINFNNVKNSSTGSVARKDDDRINAIAFNYLENQGFLSRNEDHDDYNISFSASFDSPLRHYLDTGLIDDDDDILLDGNRCLSSTPVNWTFDGIGSNNFLDVLTTIEARGGGLEKLLINNASIGVGGVCYGEDFVFNELMKAIDFEIDNVRNGKEYRTLHPDNLAMRIQLPPVNVTVTLLKAIDCYLKHSLDCDREIKMLLNKWMQTFCPISVQKRSRFRSKYMNFLDAANYGFSSGLELRDFIAVSTDLVTLIFLLNSCWRFVYVDTGGVDRGSIKLSIDGNSLHCKDISICNFNFLKIKLEDEPFDQIDSSDNDGKVKKFWDDEEATEFIEKYGAYIDIDIVSAACSAMQYRLGMDYVLSIAQTDEQMNKASTNFSHLMKSENLYSSQQFLARVMEYTAPDFNLFLTLTTHHLGSVYQKDEDLAVDLSVSFFPYIRPWNVKRALFGDSRDIAIVPLDNHLGQSRLEENRNPVQDNKNKDDNMDVVKMWHENARKKYHRYLTEMLCKFPIDINNPNSDPILEDFVNLTLYLLSQQNTKAEVEGGLNGFKKNHNESQLLQLMNQIYINKDNTTNNNETKIEMKDANFYLRCIYFCRSAFYSDNENLNTQKFIEKCKHLNII